MSRPYLAIDSSMSACDGGWNSVSCALNPIAVEPPLARARPTAGRGGSEQRVAAVDQVVGAGDECGLVTGEEHGEACNLAGVSDPADGVPLDDRLDHVLRKVH